MTKRTIWGQRVSEWRESGLTSEKFCEGREFTAGALRHWAHRLGQTQQKKDEAQVRMARVVPSPERVPIPRILAAGTPIDTRLVVEVGVGRICVGPGFDRTTFAAVVEVLTNDRREAR